MKKNFFEKPIVFMRKEYTNGPELVKAMIENWEIALSVLRRGDMPGFEEVGELMWEEFSNTRGERKNDEFFENVHMAVVLCTLDNSLSGIPYMDYNSNKGRIASLAEIGEAMLSLDIDKDAESLLLIAYAASQSLFSMINPKLYGYEEVLMISIYSYYGTDMSSLEGNLNNEEIRELEEMKKNGEELKENLRDAIIEMAATLQGKAYYKYEEDRYFSEEEFLSGVVEPAIQGEISDVVRLFYKLFESNQHKKRFMYWCDNRDEEHGNNGYRELYKKWCIFKEYAQNKYPSRWYKRSYSELPECQTPKNFFTQVNMGMTQENVINRMNEAVQETEAVLQKIDLYGQDIEQISAFLEAIRIAVLDKLNKCENSFEQRTYTCWKRVRQATEDREKRMLLMQGTTARMRSIYEDYISDCILENWDSKKLWEKEYIGSLLIFPMAEGISSHAQEVMDIVNKSRDIGMMRSLTSKIASWVSVDSFFTDKPSLRDFYFDLADILTAGMENSTDEQLEESWEDLCKTYNRVLIDTDGYRKKFSEFKSESEWCSQVHATSYLDSPNYYGRIEAVPKVEFFKGKNYDKGASFKTYTKNAEEYNALIAEFGATMQKYVNLLEMYLSDICEQAEFGKLVETKTNGVVHFEEVEAQGREELKRYVDTINAEYAKRFGNVNTLIKEEEKKIRKDKERKERKKNFRKHRSTIMVCLVLLVLLGIAAGAFYNKFMTPTYYGTESYYGTGRGYEEYTIHETATRIAPFIFQGEPISAIEIPEGIKRIEEGAFADCAQLKSIVIPASVEYIGEGAFMGCTSLEEVEFKGCILDLSDYAFAHCVNLQEIKAPKEMQFDNVSVFENCQSIDVDKVFSVINVSEDFANKIKANLYTEIVEEVPLLKNEIQLMNFLHGKDVYLEHLGVYEYPSDDKDAISNIKIEEEIITDNERKTEFSFDYRKGICIYTIEGYISGENDSSDIAYELNCANVVLSDELLYQDDSGNYTGVAMALDEAHISALGTVIDLSEEQLVVNEVIPVELTEEETAWKYAYEICAELHKPLGKFDFTGKLLISEMGQCQFECENAECTEERLYGTYQLEGGEDDAFSIDAFSIDARNGERYSVSVTNRGRSILIPEDEKNAIYTLISPGEEVYYVESVWFDWNTDRIMIGGHPYVKISEESNGLFEENSPIAGIWEGTRNLKDGRKILKRFHILTMGNGLAAIAEWIPIGNQERGDYDCTIAEVDFDEDNHTLSINDIGWVIRPAGHSFAKYEGSVNEAYTEMVLGDDETRFTKVAGEFVTDDE